MSSKRKSLALRVTSINLVSLERGRIVEYVFSMFPTWEIGFGCHVILVLKVIDFIQKYIITLYVTETNKIILVFFHQFNVKQLK